MIQYLLFAAFGLIWITVIYFFFNRKKISDKMKTEPKLQYDIIAHPQESKIRVIFDQSDPADVDTKILADLTVKYSELLTNNYKLPGTDKEPENEKDVTADETEVSDEEKTERAEDQDLSDYVNIFSIKKLKTQ